MGIGTYGIAKPLPQGRGIGTSLSAAGAGQERLASSALNQAAQQETQLDLTNRRMEGERKSGNAQLGGTIGAIAGSFYGPWGAAAGSALGSVVGGLF